MTTEVGPSTIWDRMLAGDRELTVPVADYLVRLRFPPADEARMDVLGGKANEGTLTAEESAELDAYIQIGGHLTILQSKARVALRRAAAVANGHG